MGPADQGYVQIATGANVIVGSFTPSATVPSMIVPTLVRTRGQVSVQPDVFSADVNVVGAFGIAIVSTDAFVAGAASIPGPFDQAGWNGWFVWRSFSMRFEFIDGIGVLIGDQRWEVDSKAMRKMGPQDTMVIMAESQGGAYRISTPLRHLMKLS